MLKRVFLFAALFWTVIILHFCLKSAQNLPPINIVHLDKIIHIAFHFGFTLLWFLYFKKKYINTKNIQLLVYIVLGSFIFGILIEFLQQQFTTTRRADILDILANLFGAFSAFFVIISINAYNGLIDKI